MRGLFSVGDVCAGDVCDYDGGMNCAFLRFCFGLEIFYVHACCCVGDGSDTKRRMLLNYDDWFGVQGLAMIGVFSVILSLVCSLQ